ncbi:hypothetical protein D3C72_2131280 [compost metagenome]
MFTVHRLDERHGAPDELDNLLHSRRTIAKVRPAMRAVQRLDMFGQEKRVRQAKADFSKGTVCKDHDGPYLSDSRRQFDR